LLRIFLALATFSGNNVSFAAMRFLTTTTVAEEVPFFEDFLGAIFFATGMCQS
jgi:hypothetical protein